MHHTACMTHVTSGGHPGVSDTGIKLGLNDWHKLGIAIST